MILAAIIIVGILFAYKVFCISTADSRTDKMICTIDAAVLGIVLGLGVCGLVS